MSSWTDQNGNVLYDRLPTYLQIRVNCIEIKIENNSLEGWPFHKIMYTSRSCSCYYLEAQERAPIDRYNPSTLQWLVVADQQNEIDAALHSDVQSWYEDYVFEPLYNPIRPFKPYTTADLCILCGIHRNTLTKYIEMEYIPKPYAYEKGSRGYLFNLTHKQLKICDQIKDHTARGGNINTFEFLITP